MIRAKDRHPTDPKTAKESKKGTTKYSLSQLGKIAIDINDPRHKEALSQLAKKSVEQL